MTHPEIGVRFQRAVQVGSCIPRALRLRERELQSTKWFDYRFMSPLRATSLFREEFIKVYQSFYERLVDSSEAKNRFGCRTGKFTQTDFLVFWKARQFADSLSLPYRMFLWSAFELFYEAGWQRLPKANQLYGKREDIIAAAATKYWAEKCNTFVQASELPHYRNEHYRSMPDQQAHRTWVIEQIRKNGVSAHEIGRMCFELRVIPDELAIAEFGMDLFDQARQLVAPKMPDEDELGGTPFLPSCFAVGELELIAGCSKCPYAAHCLRAGARVRAAMKTKFGSEDWATERKRVASAARVRKHRERKAAREAAAAGSSAAGVGSVT